MFSWTSGDDQETLPKSKCPDACIIFNLVFITSSFKTWLLKLYPYLKYCFMPMDDFLL